MAQKAVRSFFLPKGIEGNKEGRVKLCELGERLGRIVSNEEIDLERVVKQVKVVVMLETEPSGAVKIHQWEYTAKEQ